MKDNKYVSELSYWAKKYIESKKIFSNSHYKKIFLEMSEKETDDFITGKCIADFGCGPRGSLAWAEKASLRIGIDVLADAYTDLFYDNIILHKMIYVKSTENYIPIPSNFFDIMFMLNSLDHVSNLAFMSHEITRTLKPGGELVGSFNIGEPATLCEPQCLSEEIIKSTLLNDKYDIVSLRKAKKHDTSTYKNFFEKKYIDNNTDTYILWIRAIKRYE